MVSQISFSWAHVRPRPGKLILYSWLASDYYPAMRMYEVIMRSGAKHQIMAEVLLDDPEYDDKIWLFHDKAETQVVATFLREQVAGVVIDLDNSSAVPRYHQLTPDSDSEPRKSTR